MFKITILFFLLLSLTSSTSNFIKFLSLKHKAAAAWVLDSSDTTHFTNENNVMRFTDLISNLPLKRGGADTLTTGFDYYKNRKIPYVDFSQTDNESRGALLFSRADGLDLTSSFTLITVYKKYNENGFRMGGFLAGKWEECDRSRSYSLFGELFGKDCITAQTSNTGLASPADCTYAWEGICSGDIPNADNNDLWHTAAMVWKSNPLGEDSKENESQCPEGAKNYECEDDISKCSYVQSFVDGVGGVKKYYNYRKVYQGTGRYEDQEGKPTDILRKSLFTVGGTAAKHWKQPDHREKGRFPADFTIFGNRYEDYARENVVTGDWRDDFMFNHNGEMENLDFFVRSRYGGWISAVFVLNKALIPNELKEFNVENLFQ